MDVVLALSLTASSSSACMYPPQPLVPVAPEKLDEILAALNSALGEVDEEVGRLGPEVRKEIQEKFALDDLQMAVAVRWTPREISRRLVEPPLAIEDEVAKGSPGSVAAE